MKTAEIIKVLRCCAVGSMKHCEKECPVYGEKWDTETCNRMMAEAADRLEELAAGVLRSMPNDYGEYPPEFPREGM